MRSEGFINVQPKIKSVSFPNGEIKIVLTDRRIIICPINSFPEIKKLSLSERKKHGTLGGMGLAFQNSDEVYHISDFLGLNNSTGL